MAALAAVLVPRALAAPPAGNVSTATALVPPGVVVLDIGVAPAPRSGFPLAVDPPAVVGTFSSAAVRLTAPPAPGNGAGPMVAGVEGARLKGSAAVAGSSLVEPLEGLGVVEEVPAILDVVVLDVPPATPRVARVP